MKTTFYVLSYFFTVLCFENVESEDVFVRLYSLNSDYLKSRWFITNSTIGLAARDGYSFGYPEQITSTFIPNPLQNMWEAKCKNHPKRLWTCQKTLSEEPILDRRWEELSLNSVNLTRSIHQNGNFDVFLSNFFHYYKFNIFVIFFCDGATRSKSNCYQLSLIKDNNDNNSSEGSTIELKKSATNETVFEQIIYMFPEEYYNNMWIHLKISKTANGFFISELVGDIWIPTKLKQLRTDVNITHIIIDRNYCKIHEIEHFHVTNPIKRVKLGPTFNVEEGSICVAMFIKTCHFCQIRLELGKNASDNHIFNEEIFESKDKWNEIRFIANNINVENVNILISAIGNNNSLIDKEGQFWYFSNVKRCHKSGYRMAHSRQSLFANLVTARNSFIVFNDISMTENNNCPENTVSSHCLPCSWFLDQDQCIKLTVVEVNGVFLKHSTLDCPKQKYGYGHNCQDFCGYCSTGKCDSSTGLCRLASCLHKYSGPSCDIPPGVVIFKEPPRINNIDYTTAEIIVSNYTIIKGIDSERPTRFTIQYKRAGQRGSKWISFDKHSPFDSGPVNFRIVNLKPGTNYLVRSVTLETVNDIRISWMATATTKFKTKCDKFTAENLDIHYRITGDFANATISLETKMYCDNIFRGYWNVIENKSLRGKWNYFSRHSDILVRNLNICNEYQMILVLRTDIFTVLKKILYPSKIDSVVLKNITQTTVDVEWKSLCNYPKYSIEYTRITCKNEEPKVKNTSSSFIKIEDLVPNSRYQFAVTPVINTSPDLEAIREADTLQSLDNIYDGELPQIELVRPTPYTITVTFSEISCKKINIPPIQVEFFLTRNGNERVKDDKFIYKFENTSRNLTELEPCTEYILNISFCRNTSCQWRNISINPKKIQIWTKNITQTSVYIEWKHINNFQEYYVEYKGINKICDNTNGTKNFFKKRTKETRNNFLTIEDLVPFSHYVLTVTPVVDPSFPLPTCLKPSVEANTTEISDKVFEDEIPETKVIPGSPYTAIIKFSSVKCTFIRNSWVEVQLLLSDNDKFSKNKRFNYTFGTFFTSLTDLQPSINYFLKIKFCRRGYCKERYEIINLEEAKTQQWVYVTVITVIIFTGLTCAGATAIFYKKRQKNKTRGEKNEQVPLKYIPEEINNQNNITHGTIEKALFEQYVLNGLQTNMFIKQHETILKYVDNETYEPLRGNLFWEYVDLQFYDEKIEKAYLATDAPKEIQEAVDFWKIVLDENIENIIFIDAEYYNSEKSKITSFPEENSIQMFDDISVQHISSTPYSHYTKKFLSVTCKNTIREVVVLYFLSWSEEGLPKSPSVFNTFFQAVLQIPVRTKSPIMFSSNTHMATAGFALLCDISLRHVIKYGAVNVRRFSCILAKIKKDLIVNNKNYILAHLVILENILFKDTSVDCSSFDYRLAVLATNLQINEHFDHLKKTFSLDQSYRNLKETGCQYTYADTLNIIEVDGYRNSKKFITSRQPTKHNVGLFWKMIEEKNISVIMVPQIRHSVYKTCYWLPTQRHPLIRLPISGTTIKLKEVHEITNYFWIIATLTNKKKSEKTLNIFVLRKWPAKDECPKYPEDFANFCVETYSKMIRNVNNILVTCGDGKKGCGLYIAFLNIMEQIISERVCDICSVVRLLKCHHSEFLSSKEQFEFLWLATERYLKETNMYLSL